MNRDISSLELRGRLVAKSGVQAGSIIDLFDELPDLAPRCAHIAISTSIDFLGLQRFHEAFSLGVVVGITVGESDAEWLTSEDWRDYLPPVFP